MHLHLKRHAQKDDSTGGLLFIDGDFECYTIEDQERYNVQPPEVTKVKGETAIPRGVYTVGLRTVGGFHNRYKQRYGDMHKGMLHVKNVPNFKYILFHTGNNDDHTEGCIIVGDTIQTKEESRIPVGQTKGAYKKFYKKVRDAILNGEEVLLHVDKIGL